MKFQRLFFSVAACAVMLLGLSTTASATITGAGCVLQGSASGHGPQYAEGPLTISIATFSAACTTEAASVPGGSVVSTFTFNPPTDNISLSQAGGGTPTAGALLATGAIPCAGAGCTTNPDSSGTANEVSTTNRSTWFLFEYTLGQNVNQSLTITHDDGIELLVNGVLETPVAAEGPTSSTPTTFTFSGLAGQRVDLLYDECCGLPAVLTANLPGETPAVPEPASMVLLGSMLIGSTLVWRRRRVKG